MRPARRPPTLRIVAWSSILAGGAAALGYELHASGAQQPGEPVFATLPVLAALLVAAEYLFVRFRFRGEISALNLVEAALAPVLFAFPPVTVIVIVAVSLAVGELLRRNAPIKATFNIAQWSLAAGTGALVVSGIAGDRGLDERAIIALILGLGVVGLVNQTAFSVVIAIAERHSIRKVFRGLGSNLVAGWLVGWAVNSAVGLLFVFAYNGHPVSVALFPVPLIVLHLAYRGYAGARSDRVRLSGLHSAARLLAEPLDPSSAIAPFLREVATSFEAPAAALVLASDDLIEAHTVDLREGNESYAISQHRRTERVLEASVLRRLGPVRIVSRTGDDLAKQLAIAGWRECLAAPLVDGELATGALLVYDQAGLEGFAAGELAVLQAVARETASTISKGRLLERILEERRRLSEIVSSTSDGIVTINAEGFIESWNPAMERITGIPANEIVGTRGRLAGWWFSAADDQPVTPANWAHGEHLPTDIRAIDSSGRPHRLSVSYSTTFDEGDRLAKLVIIARDESAEAEIEELRYETGRLSRSIDAQRRIVERLQEAVMPAPLVVTGLDLGVSYLASDPLAPTGGDLYDWMQLPNGQIQIAVVDVLGHGVQATKDAVSVVHALRVLAAQGCPIDQIVARADEVLNAQEAELVATVVVVRIDPVSGVAKVAAGGHPPALVTSMLGGVRQVPAPGGPIGWPGAGSASTVELQLAHGEALILYTDGLIEAGKDILAGEEALMRHARALIDESAADMARGLLDRSLSAGARRDDSVAVVVRRSPAEERKAWRLEPDADRIGAVRSELRDWLSGRGVTTDELDDVSMIATELLSNGIRAARTSVSLRASLAHGEMHIEVEDDGPGDPSLDEIGRSLPDDYSPGGRGLFVVRALSDDVRTLSTSEGTIVTSIRRLSARPVVTRRMNVPRSDVS